MVNVSFDGLASMVSVPHDLSANVGKEDEDFGSKHGACVDASAWRMGCMLSPSTHGWS